MLHLPEKLKADIHCLMVIAVLATATLFVFHGILDHQFLVNWDDDFYVTDNTCIRGLSLDNLKAAFSRTFAGNYAPVQVISYMIDYELWGLTPRGFLFTNLLLHLMAGILLWRFALRTGATEITAFAIALLFLVHPVQVESVAWVSQRKTLLCTVFFLSCLHSWRTWRLQEGMGHFLLSLLFFILSLLSKSLAVILPFAILLHDWLLLGERDRRILIRPLTTFFAMAFIIGLLTLLTQEAWEGGGRTTWHGGTPWNTFWTMPHVFVRYASLLLWPTRLSVFYNIPTRINPDFTSVAVLLLIVFLSIILTRASSRNPLIGLYSAIVALGLIPVSQIVPIVTLMNDRYLYLPMVGIAGLFGLAVGRCAKVANAVTRSVLLCTMVGLILIFAILARQRVSDWNNSITLWSDAAKKEPDSSIPWLALADIHYIAGHFDQSWKYYRILHSINLKKTAGDKELGDLKLSLAEKLIEEGDFSGAEKMARAAILDVEDGNTRPLEVLAIIRMKNGDSVAVKELEALILLLKETEALEADEALDSEP